MLKKKDGYALVYVVGLIALILFMVATLTNFTMQRTYNINRNVYGERDVREAKMNVEIASMHLMEYLTMFNNLQTEVLPLKDTVKNMIEDTDFITLKNNLKDRYNVDIVQRTSFSDEVKYSIQFIVESTIKGVTVERPVYLTNLPSFIFFALGSKEDVYLNGGIYVDGDIYAGNNVYLSNEITYIYNEILSSEPTSKTEMRSNRSIFLENDLKYCDIDIKGSCFNIGDSNSTSRMNFDSLSVTGNPELAFFTEAPVIRDYNQRFLDVNIERSYNYYRGNITDSVTVTSLQEIQAESGLRSVIYEGDLTISDQTLPNFRENPNFTFKKKNDMDEMLWVVVDGDLIIENRQIDPYLNINANFLVKGNIKISGNIGFNSIIYTLNENKETDEFGVPTIGTSKIDNASIRALDSGTLSSSNQLILLSKGNIQVSKINPFINNRKGLTFEEVSGSYEVNPDLEAFLFTQQNFEVYAVSSYIAMRGGIFAQADTEDHIPNTTDSRGLMVNAYRGDVSIVIDETTKEDTLAFERSSDVRNSRFVIQHSQSLLKYQPEGLPLNDNFNFLFGDITIRN